MFSICKVGGDGREAVIEVGNHDQYQMVSLFLQVCLKLCKQTIPQRVLENYAFACCTTGKCFDGVFGLSALRYYFVRE